MKVTINDNNKKVDISASKETLNYLSIIFDVASISFKQRGSFGLSEQAREYSNQIYELLAEKGCYKK